MNDYLDVDELRGAMTGSISREKLQYIMDQRQHAKQILMDTEWYLTEVLDDFTGTLQEAIQIGLVKAAFPVKRGGKRR